MGPVERAKHALREQAGRHERQVDHAMALLALLLLVVVVAQPLIRDRTLSSILTVVGYVVWAVFIAEFLLRWWLAPDRVRFLRSDWWRGLLLAVPFLRFVRLFQALHVAQFGRAAISFVRGSSAAARQLSERLLWLTALTALVILASSSSLYLTGAYRSYPQALQHCAFSTISGEPLEVETGLAQVLEVVLAAYSVIVFAALAGSIGAYFLGDRRRDRGPDHDEKQ